VATGGKIVATIVATGVTIVVTGVTTVAEDG
jgi:hypothetical protein